MRELFQEHALIRLKKVWKKDAAASMTKVVNDNQKSRKQEKKIIVIGLLSLSALLLVPLDPIWAHSVNTTMVAVNENAQLVNNEQSEYVAPVSDSEIEINENVPDLSEFNDFEQSDILDQLSDDNSQIKVSGDFKDPSKLRKKFGSWSWRDGVICVTDDGKPVAGFNTWHAGIVIPQEIETVAESSPSTNGVKYHRGPWSTKIRAGKNVWQTGVKRTTVEQDWRAGYWAGQQKGKKYNYNLWDLSHTRDFYCSSLVYHAYRQTTGVNLNVNGGVMWVHELLPTYNSQLGWVYSRK